jgi:ribulose bisphosphate carboxylase small subunit
LESKGIDVILEMDWLSKHKALIDYPKKYVKLIALDGKELEYVIEHVVTAKGDVNRVRLN